MKELGEKEPDMSKGGVRWDFLPTPHLLGPPQGNDRMLHNVLHPPGYVVVALDAHRGRHREQDRRK